MYSHYAGSNMTTNFTNTYKKYMNKKNHKYCIDFPEILLNHDPVGPAYQVITTQCALYLHPVSFVAPSL